MISLAPGAEVGEYQIERRIGDGPDSVIYLAAQPRLGRHVALHVAVDAAADAFAARARMLACVEHPNLLAVYDVAGDHDCAYAAAALSAGPTIAELTVDRRLPADLAIAVVEEVAAAVEALQGVGVEFSPSPANVVVEGGLERPVVVVDPLGRASAPTPVVASLGALLSTLVEPSERRLLALARRATDTTEIETPGRFAVAARSAVTRKRRRRHRVAVASAAALLVAAATAALIVAGTHHARTRPAATASAARIVARIIIGEQPAVVAAAGGRIWIATTKDHVLQIDPDSNRVVGSPLRFPAHVRVAQAVSVAGITLAGAPDALYVLVAEDGRILRLDPRSGRVLARSHAAPELSAAVRVGRDLWVTRTPPQGDRTGRDELLQLDARTLRPRRPPIPVGHFPENLTAGRGFLEVMGSGDGSITRVDTQTGRTRSVLVGAQPARAAIVGRRLWIVDPVSEVLTGIDARLTQPADRVLPVGAARQLLVAGRSLYVVRIPGNGVESPARLLRIDPATGRAAGKPLDLGTEIGLPVAADGALWLPDVAGDSVLRVAPTAPAPATHPLLEASRGQLRSGPATPGRKMATLPGVRLSIDVRDSGWINTVVPDIVDVRRFADLHVGTSILTPTQVLGPHGSVHRVTSPTQLLAVLQRVRTLRVGPVSHITLNGFRGLSSVLSVVPGSTRPPFCAEPCVPIYARGGVTTIVEPKLRLTLLDVRGTTVAIGEDTHPDARSLSTTGAIVRTIHFA